MKRTIHNPVLDGTITFLTTAKESHGSLTELEATIMPGGRNPPHYHRSYDETFAVLEGVLQLDLGKKLRRQLRAGESYVVSAGTVHSFRNESDAPVRIRTRVIPGNEGFENSLRIFAGLALDGHYNLRLRIPSSFQHLAISAVMSDTRLPFPLSFLNLTLRLVASFARWRGVEKQLLARYASDM